MVSCHTHGRYHGSRVGCAELCTEDPSAGGATLRRSPRRNRPSCLHAALGTRLTSEYSACGHIPSCASCPSCQIEPIAREEVVSRRTTVVLFVVALLLQLHAVLAAIADAGTASTSAVRHKSGTQQANLRLTRAPATASWSA